MVALLIAVAATLANPVVPTVEDAQKAYAAGAEAAGRKDYGAAFEYFSRAAQLDPKNDGYFANAAAAAWWLGKKDAVPKLFAKAIAAAIPLSAYDRIAAYNHQLLLFRYTLPDAATAKRNRASAVPPSASASIAPWQQLYGQANGLLQRGRYAEAMDSARQAVALAEAQFGNNHPFTLTSVNNLADLHRVQGELDEALILYRRVLRASKKVLGSKHPDTFVFMNNLASVHQGQGDHQEAAPIFRKVVRLAKQVLGPSHPITATYIQNLALFYTQREDYARAEPLHEQALASKRAALGNTHPDTIVALNNLAVHQRALGAPKKAAPLLEEATGQARATLGEAHPATKSTTENLTSVYEELGTLNKLQPLMDSALAQSVADHGEAHQDSVLSMNHVADLYLRRGLYAQAERMFNQALALSRQMHGDDDVNTWTVMNNLGLVYTRMGRYPEAQRLHEEAVRRSTATLGPDADDTLGFKNNLALLYNAQGLFDRARGVYEEVYQRRRQQVAAQHPERLRAQFNLGMTYLNLGLYRRALPMLEQAMAGRRKVRGPAHPETLYALNGLALLHSDRANFAKAQPLYEEVLAARRRGLGSDHPDTLTSQENLAWVYLQQGRLDKAIAVFKAVLDARRRVLGSDHQNTVLSMGHLGAAYAEAERYDEAVRLFQQAVDTAQAKLGGEHPTTLMTYNNAAHVMRLSGRYDDALRLQQHTLEVGTRRLGATHPQVLTYQNNLALTHQNLGHVAQARRLFAASLAGKRKILGEAHPETVIAYVNLAHLEAAAERWEEADRWWRERAAATTSFLARVLWGADVRTRQSYVGRERQVDDQMLSYLVARGAHGAREILRYVLQRKGLLLKVASEVQAVAIAADDPALKQVAERLAKLRGELADRTLAGPGGQAPAAFAATMIALESDIERLEAQLGRNVARLQRAARTVTPEGFVAALPKGARLVDYFAFQQRERTSNAAQEHRLAALVVDHGGVRTLNLGPLAPVEQAIQDYRALLMNPRTARDRLEAAARGLYQQLWQPVKEVAGEMTTVYVVPDAALHLLPFPALKNPQGRYLVQEQRLVVLNSARDLALAPPQGDAADVAIFAAPEYGAPAQRKKPRRSLGAGQRLRDLVFTPLPGTAQEARAISAQLTKRRRAHRVYASSDATETTLETLASPHILHLATHGFFLTNRVVPAARSSGDTARGVFVGTRPRPSPAVEGPASPASNEPPDSVDPLMRAGLALAGANLGLRGSRQANGSDGILTALEVLGLDLVGTELVVLSACDTGVGEVSNGEGVYGLRRAFQEAGAQAVLSTLWSIDDAGTQAFMNRFYAAFLGGIAPQEALRAAQQAFIADEAFAHPFYWAPFVMAGRR